jgi:hypothetical protein
MLVVVNAALLLAGETAGAGVDTFPRIIVVQGQDAAGNAPGNEHFSGREVGLQLVHFTGGAGGGKYIEDILAGAAVRAPVEKFLKVVQSHDNLLVPECLKSARGELVEPER